LFATQSAARNGKDVRDRQKSGKRKGKTCLPIPSLPETGRMVNILSIILT
jgi:hypothetical protein